MKMDEAIERMRKARERIEDSARAVGLSCSEQIDWLEKRGIYLGEIVSSDVSSQVVITESIRDEQSLYAAVDAVLAAKDEVIG